MEHEDAGMDVELIKGILNETIEPLITVIKEILNKQAAMDEELDGLHKLVVEELIGGITDMYHQEERIKGIGSLSSKYGEKFSPFGDFYKELSGGSDIMEKLYEELQERKSSKEDWSDSDEESTIEELLNELTSRHERIKGLTAPKATEVEVVVEKEEPKEEPKDEMEALREKVRKMKEMNAKNGKSSF